MALFSPRTSGWATMAGGAMLLVAGPTLDAARIGEADANPSLVRLAQAVYVASVPGLVMGVHTLSARLAAGGRTTNIGKGLAYAGLATTAVGSLLFVINPTDIQWLNPVGSVFQSVGLLLLGGVSLRSSALNGWTRIVPLLLGAWFFAHMPAQFAFFASPSGIPSHTFMFGGWGPLWMLLGITLMEAQRAES